MSALDEAKDILRRLRGDADVPFSATFAIAKSDDELRTVWGYASVIEVDDKPVIDEQGDLLYEPELVKAAHDFMLDSRIGGLMHARGQNGEPIAVGRVVESMVLTKGLKTAAGITSSMVGWLVGVHIPDQDVWNLVKAGALPAFSIGGTGVRVPVEVD